MGRKSPRHTPEPTQVKSLSDDPHWLGKEGERWTATHGPQHRRESCPLSIPATCTQRTCSQHRRGSHSLSMPATCTHATGHWGKKGKDGPQRTAPSTDGDLARYRYQRHARSAHAPSIDGALTHYRCQRHARTRPDTTQTTRHDTTRHGATRHDTTRHDTTRHDTTRHGTAQQCIRQTGRSDRVIDNILHVAIAQTSCRHGMVEVRNPHIQWVPFDLQLVRFCIACCVHIIA